MSGRYLYAETHRKVRRFLLSQVMLSTVPGPRALVFDRFAVVAIAVRP